MSDIEPQSSECVVVTTIGSYWYIGKWWAVRTSRYGELRPSVADLSGLARTPLTSWAIVATPDDPTAPPWALECAARHPADHYPVLALALVTPDLAGRSHVAYRGASDPTPIPGSADA